MQTLILMCIVGLAAGYLILKFIQTLKAKHGACCDNCTQCAPDSPTSLEDWTTDQKDRS
jgi:hypothetical protein